MAPAVTTTDSKRSWRSASSGTLVRRSRHLWRWLFSALALLLIVTALLIALRGRPQTMLFVLTSSGSGRDERTVLPLVPLVEDDRDAILEWGSGAKIPYRVETLTNVENPHEFVRRLADSKSENRYVFALDGQTGNFHLGRSDTLVLYIKGHGLSIDVSKDGTPDIRPIIVKSLKETDLETPWFRSASLTIDVAELLDELSSRSQLRKLVILDAVHLNYDPRLGTLVNGFPQAVQAAVENLKEKKNLWVVLGQDDGELAVGLPESGRSAFVDSLVKSLEQKPGQARSIGVEALFKEAQERLSKLAGENRVAFKQELQTIFPSAASSQAIALKTSPPPTEEEKDSGAAGKAAAKVGAKILRSMPGYNTAVKVGATARKARRLASKAGKLGAKPAPAGVPSGEKSAESATATAAGTTTPGAAVGAANQPAVAAAAPAGSAAPTGPVKSDLDEAWEVRDRLRAKFRDGWSPVHVAPDEWRRVESLLVGFDEFELFQGLEEGDEETLRGLMRSLKRLESVFLGEESSSALRRDQDQCKKIAEGYQRFSASDAYRKFDKRDGGGLAEANESLKVFAEGAYWALDYVRLHGQMCSLADGGRLFNELETLLDELVSLRALFNPSKLSDGRLTDSRRDELARVARSVERRCGQIDENIKHYAEQTAAAPPSPGKLLRCALLLHSPLLPADIRRLLREAADSQPQTSVEPLVSAAMTSEILASNLKKNLQLQQKLLAATLPSADGPGQPACGAGLTSRRLRLGDLVERADTGSPHTWATLGREYRELAEALPPTLRQCSGRAAGQPDSPASEMFDLYVATLLIDGRDAERWRNPNTPPLALTQPLKSPAIRDRVTLVASAPQLQLPSPSSEGKPLQLTIHVESERPPPYTVGLDLNWDAGVNVVRQGGGSPLRASQELRLDRADTTLDLRVSAARESKDAAPTFVRARARFAAAPPASADIACVLPRPDQVEITIAGDNNLAAARERLWSGYEQQGGRISFFVNREKAFQVYLANLSSEEKQLEVRLYKVPRWAAGEAGRLFDPRMPGQLLKAPATLDVALARPGADLLEIPRDFLIAQTKEPLVLAASQEPVKVPLVPPAAAAPPAAPAAAPAPPKPAEKGEEITDGLLLVLSSADGKGMPFRKWIELQMLQPDDLLQIQDQSLRDGRLTFRVGLKDPKLVDEMGLVKQPMTLALDDRALPPSARVEKKDLVLKGAPNAVDFAALLPPNLRPPFFLQLHVDGDPRGLVASLAEGLALENWKKDRPPAVHISRVMAVAERSNGPAKKEQILIRPPSLWLGFPSPPAGGEKVPEVGVNEPLLVAIDQQKPMVLVEADLAADVAPDIFSDGAHVRIELDQLAKEYAADRDVHVRLTSLDGNGLHITSTVSDFRGIAFDPIEVKRDMRMRLIASVVAPKLSPALSNARSHVVPLILDCTPPRVWDVSAERLDPRPQAKGPPQIPIHVKCHADDGQGSGIAKVQFFYGIDSNNNGRLDEKEPRPAVPANKNSGDLYEGDFSLPPELSAANLLIEAKAIDNVQFASDEAVPFTLLAPPKPTGAERTTFGKGAATEPPAGKKKP